MVTERPKRGHSMSPVAYTLQAREWVIALEDKARRRGAGTLGAARQVVSHEIGVNPVTLENLRKDRVKSVPAHVYDALRAGLIHALEKELGHLEHELHLLRANPRSSAGQDAPILADIQIVRRALGLDPSEGGADTSHA